MNASSEFVFGCGPGHLPRSASFVASQHGAVLINYTDPGCKCGRRCSDGDCPECRRHWFASTNKGEPFNSRLASEVEASL